MEKMMNLATQCLAAAGIRFLIKEEDDSHANLSLAIETGRLQTQPLSRNGDTLSLDYTDRFLRWDNGNDRPSFSFIRSIYAKVPECLQEKSETQNPLKQKGNHKPFSTHGPTNSKTYSNHFS